MNQFGKSVFSSMKQSRSSKFSAMSVQTECRTWKLVFKSYAEVPPDFAKQCQCKPNAERWELALKSYAEVPPDFAKQRYNIVTPKYKFLNHLISHLDIVEPKITVWKAIIYRHFRAFFKFAQKWNQDILFYLMPIIKTYESPTFCLPRPTAISHTPLCYRIAFVPVFCIWVMKYKQYKRMFHFEVAHSLVLLGVKLVC